MRLIGTLDDERRARLFSEFLQKKQIAHRVEIDEDRDWGSSAYGSRCCRVWIEEEHQVEEALRWFEAFVADPEDPQFRPSPELFQEAEESPAAAFSPPSPGGPRSSSWEREPMGPMTRALLVVCCALFFLSQIWVPASAPERYGSLLLLSSPVERALLYDYPKLYELLYRFVEKYGAEAEQPVELPPEGRDLFDRIRHTRAWPGAYDLLAKGGIGAVAKGLAEDPTFEKIKEGQYWRLFSPILLHGNVLHLLFNMLWLVVLGKQMEQRLRPWRYACFILAVAAFSNTAQYLVSGPNFLGFSGVLCGMLAFIWVRQRRAAWEGYRMDRLTFAFMLVFVLGLAALQTFAFFAEKWFHIAISSNMANTAHVSGGCMGLWLGRFHFFGWRDG